jgi:hydroxyacylglutathione hydrolase
MDVVVHPLRMFQDNYSYVLAHGRDPVRAIVVDPGDADSIWEFLESHRYELEAVLVTHHHWDHVGGIEGLVERRPVEVFCSRADRERVPKANRGLDDGEKIQFGELSIETIHVPGHTLGHVVYRCGRSLFSGDTLFLGGCGRLFEGTAEQLFHSLHDKILALPDATEIYPGHEYTVECRSFCSRVETSNKELIRRLEEARELRKKGLPTVPGCLRIEKGTNVFLRCHEPVVIRAVQSRFRDVPSDPAAVFAKLRTMKDAD